MKRRSSGLSFHREHRPNRRKPNRMIDPNTRTTDAHLASRCTTHQKNTRKPHEKPLGGYETEPVNHHEDPHVSEPDAPVDRKSFSPEPDPAEMGQIEIYYRGLFIGSKYMSSNFDNKSNYSENDPNCINENLNVKEANWFLDVLEAYHKGKLSEKDIKTLEGTRLRQKNKTSSIHSLQRRCRFCISSRP
mmetsp:Transcript_2570/g.5007  ORF Transcript_2570/g.5007 Transcript_2570/m.5007 type:complete len:189 (+) Transcript_2570:46-612(+)